jgi:hypothetical protein
MAPTQPIQEQVYDDGSLTVSRWTRPPAWIKHRNCAVLEGTWQKKYARVLERFGVTHLSFDARPAIALKQGKLSRASLQRFRDLAFVAELSHVTSLFVMFRKDADLTPLVRMPNLRELSLDFRSGSKVALALDTLPHLTQLETTWSPAFTGWEALTRLESLKLTHLLRVQRLDLTWAKRLKDLAIWHAGSLVDIVGPQLNRTLRSLDISFAPRFERIVGSAANTSIKQLDLVAVRGIAKDFLGRLGGVRSLQLGSQTPPLDELLARPPKLITRMPV